jgi:nicotinate dehydrogenase subunit A
MNGAAPLALKVNGATHVVCASADTPLLYLLRNDLALNGPKFGCGLGECGACTVLLDGMPTRACVTTAKVALGHEITTLEGLGTRTALHPVQQAFIDEQAAQCGYCLSGMIMTTKALLERDPHPSVETICRELSRNLCRCGTHVEIVRAVQRAAELLATQKHVQETADKEASA